MLSRTWGRLEAHAAAVDDRVAGDRIQPRRTGAALGLVRTGGAPDRGEGLLDRVLGAAAVAEAAKRQPENRARIAAAEHFGSGAGAGSGPQDQLAVARLGGRHGLHRG